MSYIILPLIRLCLQIASFKVDFPDPGIVIANKKVTDFHCFISDFSLSNVDVLVNIGGWATGFV